MPPLCHSCSCKLGGQQRGVCIPGDMGCWGAWRHPAGCAGGRCPTGLTMALTTLPMYTGSLRREQSRFWSLRNLGFVSRSLRQMDKMSSSNWCRGGRKGV